MRAHRFIPVVSVLALTFAATAEGPVLHVTAPNPAIVGEAAVVAFTLKWEGSADEWIVLPPDLATSGVELPDLQVPELRLQPQSAEATFQITFSPADSMDYEIPPLTFELEHGTSGERVTVSSEEVVIPASVPIPVWVWILAGLLFLGLLTVLARVARKRKSPSEAAPSPADQARELIHKARREALDGNFYAYYRTLADASALVGAENHGKLMKRAQEVGFQAIRPPDDELEGVMREVEQAIARYKEKESK